MRVEDRLFSLSEILETNPSITRRGALGGVLGAALAVACAPAAPPGEVRPAPAGRIEPTTAPAQPVQRVPERPASGDTTGWKDYSSPLGFNIKYPPTGHIIHIPYSKEVSFVTPSPSGDGILISIRKSDITDQILQVLFPGGQFVGSNISPEERLEKAVEMFQKRGFAVENLKVGGINAVRAKGKDAYYYFDIVYFTGTNDWTIRLERTTLQDADRGRQALDGMLSSFRLNKT